ncbi:TPA: DNA gyrase subunit A, partial [Candidatus Micrarchaeota archaeon]|nr:DNA gyrase subunit A [Candidatus Micrarchaeota archaeon]
AIIEEIARLVQQKKIEGITDIRDESNRQGIRVVLELRRGENPDVLMNLLYQHTKLEVSYGIHMLAIQNLQPRLMSLRDLMVAFLQHRREVILRRTAYELREAQARLHIVEGLLKALDEIDAIIDHIRRSATVVEARRGLVERFGFTEVQAQAILEMQLQRLTGLERQRVQAELQQLRTRIRELQAILAEEPKLWAAVKAELAEIKEKYEDARRSRILSRIPTLQEEDLIRPETVVVTATEGGYIKRSPLRAFSVQRRGGRGRVGMSTREQDVVAFITVASTLDYLWFFFSSGRVYQLRVHELPEAALNARGRALVNFLSIRPDEQLVAVLRWPYGDESAYAYCVLGTERGRI